MSYWDDRYMKTKPASWQENGIIIFKEVTPMLVRGNYKKMLDFGCGDGGSFEFLNEIGEGYIGFDTSKVAIQQAKEKYPLGLFINVPAKGRNFDLIYCGFVLQHILDDDELLERLKEFRVMLGRGGELLVIDNISRKDNLGYMIFRSEVEHETLFEMACFEVAESKIVKIDNEDVKIWRMV